jgi:hypothetical protein
LRLAPASALGLYWNFISCLSIQGKARHRPGPYARQDGGGVLTAPISIRARSSCIVLDALRALPPVLGHEAALAHSGACWPHGSRDCCSGSMCVRPALEPMAGGPHLLRLAERRFCGLLFQEPPRTTRREGVSGSAIDPGDRSPANAGTMAADTKLCQRKQAEGSEAATIIAVNSATSRVR